MVREINQDYPHNAQPMEEVTDPYYETILELDRVRKETRQDKLTSLPNEKSLIEFVNIFDTRPYAMIATYIDLKGFGEINREIGHEAADRKIVEFSDFLKNEIRKSDLLFRHHGDEFVLLSPKRDNPSIENTPEDGLKEHLSKINQKSQIKFEFESVTFDLEKHESLKDVINEADKALMARKQKAREQKAQQNLSVQTSTNE